MVISGYRQYPLPLAHVYFPRLRLWGPFLKSSYERFLLYEFVELALNYRSNEFVVQLRIFVKRGPGNKPGLGAMETAYIPHNHTLTV